MRFRRLPLLFLGLVCFSAFARAVTVDWDATAWTPGTLTNSYDVDSSVPGNDLTFALGGTTGELANDSVNNLPTPNVNTNLEGGLTPVQPNPHWRGLHLLFGVIAMNRRRLCLPRQ